MKTRSNAPGRRRAVWWSARPASWLTVLISFAIGWGVAASGNDQIGVLRPLLWLNALPLMLVPDVESRLISGLLVNLVIVLGSVLSVFLGIPVLPLTGAFAIGRVLGEWYLLSEQAGVSYPGLLARTIIPHGLVELPAFLFFYIQCIEASIRGWRQESSGRFLVRGCFAVKQLAPAVLVTILLLVAAAILEWAGPTNRFSNYLKRIHGPIIEYPLSGDGTLRCNQERPSYTHRSKGITFLSNTSYDQIWMQGTWRVRYVQFRRTSSKRRSLLIENLGPFGREETAVVRADALVSRCIRQPGWQNYRPAHQPAWPPGLTYIRHLRFQGGDERIASTELVLSAAGRWIGISFLYDPSEEQDALCDLARITESLTISRSSW